MHFTTVYLKINLSFTAKKNMLNFHLVVHTQSVTPYNQRSAPTINNT